jgi:hypothetical protein
LEVGGGGGGGGGVLGARGKFFCGVLVVVKGGGCVCYFRGLLQFNLQVFYQEQLDEWCTSIVKVRLPAKRLSNPEMPEPIFRRSSFEDP